MSGGSSLAAIVAKRARHVIPGADLPHGDPTGERRAELSKHRSRLTRALDDASFEQAAIDYDACLDVISEGVGKTHNISQDECDAESLWLCEMLESRGQGLRPIASVCDDPLGHSPLTPYSGGPVKKKPRMTPGSAPGTPGDQKKEIVHWTKFHTISSCEMGIAQERAVATDKESLKACAKLAKSHVTCVENAREIIRTLIKDHPHYAIDPEKITSELVTTRTVKSDHLKFWYLKPNFKDKDIELLLRVARHKSGLTWEISHGVQQAAHCSSTPSMHIAGIGSLTQAASNANAAAAGAAAQEANALAMLSAPAQHASMAPYHTEGHIIKSVVVNGDTGLELGGMGSGMGGDGEHDGSVGMHDLSGMGGGDMGGHGLATSLPGLGVPGGEHSSVDTMIHSHIGVHDQQTDHHVHVHHSDLMAPVGGEHEQQVEHMPMAMSGHDGLSHEPLGHEQLHHHHHSVDEMQQLAHHEHMHVTHHEHHVVQHHEQHIEPHADHAHLEAHHLEATHEPSLAHDEHSLPAGHDEDHGVEQQHEHHLEADEPPISHHVGHDMTADVTAHMVHAGDVGMDM